MSVSLQKGQRVSLVKDNNPVKNLVVGLGWDMNKLGKKIMT
ncbi:TerD family protein [Clostridioides difficile]|nr:General stress protein 16U [Clostridioides difficile]EQG75418.1 tellurium resistance TerD domain protein [Clostridioides difficile DA00165]